MSMTFWRRHDCAEGMQCVDHPPGRNVAFGPYRDRKTPHKGDSVTGGSRPTPVNVWSSSVRFTNDSLSYTGTEEGKVVVYTGS